VTESSKINETPEKKETKEELVLPNKEGDPFTRSLKKKGGPFTKGKVQRGTSARAGVTKKAKGGH